MTEYKAGKLPELGQRGLTDAIKAQRSLLEVYASREKRLKEPDYMDHQMATAYTAELAEFLAWMDRKEYLEAMFEAVDMWHFALEGLIASGATFHASDALGTTPADSRFAVLAVGRLLRAHNWKHWKKPAERRQDEATAAYKKMLAIAFSFFAKAYSRHCRKAKCKRQPADRMFLACYFMKSDENARRQKEGY